MIRIITRFEARNMGLKRFYSGTPCIHGHLCERLTTNGTCIICTYDRIKNIAKRDRVKNRVKHAKRERERWERIKNENPEKYEDKLQKKRDWYKRNKNLIRKYDEEKRKKFPELKRGYEAKRNTLKTKAGGFYTVHQIKEMMRKQKEKCVNCFTCISDVYEIDHIVPVSMGGTSWIYNIQLLCKSCNRKKSAKDPFMWAKENGRLL